MGNKASLALRHRANKEYVLRRASAGPLAQAHSSSLGTRGWLCWNLDSTPPDELAELAGPGAALLVSETGGKASVAGRYGGDTAWHWVYDEHEPLPARARETAVDIQDWARDAGLSGPDEDALVNTLLAKNPTAMDSVHDLFVVIGVWEPV
jgi:hypothetical protein